MHWRRSQRALHPATRLTEAADDQLGALRKARSHVVVEVDSTADLWYSKEVLNLYGKGFPLSKVVPNLVLPLVV